LIRAHLAAFVEECPQDTAPMSETVTIAASSMDSGTDELQKPTSEPPQKNERMIRSQIHLQKVPCEHGCGIF
jgi:hypothetical protein